MSKDLKNPNPDELKKLLNGVAPLNGAHAEVKQITPAELDAALAGVVNTVTNNIFQMCQGNSQIACMIAEEATRRVRLQHEDILKDGMEKMKKRLAAAN